MSNIWRNTLDFFIAPAYDESQDVQERAIVESAGGTTPLQGVLPPAWGSLVESVTPETALSIGTVYRSVDILSTLTSQMDLVVKRQGIIVPSPALIKKPNVDDTLRNFIQETVTSLALHGNAYWLVTRASDNTVANVQVLAPEFVTIERDKKTGRKVFHVGGDKYQSDRVKHLKLNSRAGNDYGFGPVQVAKTELAAALRLAEFENTWFGKHIQPDGVLYTDQTLSAEQAAEMSQAWTDFMATHGFPVLSNGLRYESLRLKPSEAQYIEVKQQNDKNIARLFGIPALNLLVEMGGTSMTYVNLEQSNILFLQNTLRRYMDAITDALTELLPRGQVVEFVEEDLLRMDTVTKWNVIKTQTEVGYTTGNEIRQGEGKAPLALPTVANSVKENVDDNGN